MSLLHDIQPFYTFILTLSVISRPIIIFFNLQNRNYISESWLNLLELDSLIGVLCQVLRFQENIFNEKATPVFDITLSIL